MATKKNSKIIDVKDNAQIKALNFDKLIDDAIARKDKAAAEWLAQKNTETQERVSKKGKKYTVGASFLLVRNEYLEKFCGWQPNPTVKPTLEEKQAKRAAKLAKILEAAE